MRTREDKALTLFSDNFCKILANLSPLPSEGSGEASFRAVLLVGAFLSSNHRTLRLFAPF